MRHNELKIYGCTIVQFQIKSKHFTNCQGPPLKAPTTDLEQAFSSSKEQTSFKSKRLFGYCDCSTLRQQSLLTQALKRDGEQKT